jgi:RimJ/RimL family protein N-acetyltransferase
VGSNPRSIEFPIGGISDDDLRLRLRSDADIPALVAACSDPEIPRWTRVPDDYDVETAREFAAVAARELAEGAGLHLLAVDGDDTLLASVGIVGIDWDEGRCEVGYWAVAEHRGHGLVTRAVRLLCGWIFENLPIERIGIAADPENAASRRVAEKAGFTFEGVLRSWVVNKGRRCDAAMYSLIRGELR